MLTAWFQVDSFWMERGEMTDVELIDGVVKHIRKASGSRPDFKLANWCRSRSCLHAACDKKFEAWIASVAHMVEVEKGSERVCVL